MDKVAPVEGVSADDLRSAVWTYRSGVNVRHEQPGQPPGWWMQFERQLDAASVNYWRPFALPPTVAREKNGGKHGGDSTAASSSSLDAASKMAVPATEVIPSIKSFFAQVSQSEAEAMAAAAAAASAAAGKSSSQSLVGSSSQVKAVAAGKPSLKSFFSQVTEEEAEAATGAAAAAATAAAAAATNASAAAIKRKRAGTGAAALDIQKFFGASGNSNGVAGSSGGIIIIDD